MTFVSYAQNFEDVLLWRALRDVEDGRYLDVGAQDPVIDSVSLAFYEAGWRGTHVEATPFYAARLRDARPDEMVIEAAVTDADGPIEFYEIPETGLSTGKAEVASRQANAGFPGRKIVVPCVRLDQLLEMADADFHWLKIDVEGMEADVLRSWRRSKRRPWLLVVESTFPSTQEPTEQLWIEEVLCRGYQQVFFDGLSRYFVHENHIELADRFLAPANVFDSFGVAESHFAVRAIAGSFSAELENAHANFLRGTAQLTAEAEQLRRAAATAGEERDCARAALETTVVAREAATAERDLAREKETVAQAQLIATQQEHRAALEALWRDRQMAEDELRRAALALEQSHRAELQQAQAIAAEARVQLARVEERCAHQQELLRLSQERFAQQQVQLSRTEATTKATAERLEQHRASITKASALIRGVLSERVGRWQHLGLIFGFARPSPAIQSLSEWIGAGHEVMATPDDLHLDKIAQPGASMLAQSTTEQCNPYLRANSLPELLSWHDVDFVRCAYVTILGRQPDPEGEIYYTGRIRRGHSKLEVLAQLRRSPEGPQHDPGIAGLDRALKWARWERHPIVGWAVRGLTGGEGNSGSWKRHRALLNQAALIQMENTRQGHWMSGIDAKLQHLSEKLSQPTEATPVTTDLAVSAHEHPAKAPITPTEPDPELDSRSRYALQLLQLEARAS